MDEASSDEGFARAEGAEGERRMSEDPVPDGREDRIRVVVVTYESAAVVAGCLESLRAAAPRRGVDIRVVDNASSDESAAIAAAMLGCDNVLRMPANRGFAAGVNAGFAGATGTWIAVVNPDVRIPAGGLDRLADVLEHHPAAGLAAPRVVDGRGRAERSVGLFPTPRREWVHSWLLDHVGWPGRWARPCRDVARVEWVSGCAWLLRAEAVRAVGPLDEGYFMYAEDVDYCRRFHDAGWDVLAVPQVEWEHRVGSGSSATPALAADGGTALLRYYGKFHPRIPESRVRALLLRGWRLRLLWRRARARLGDPSSAAVARRYEIAIRQLDCT